MAQTAVLEVGAGGVAISRNGGPLRGCYTRKILNFRCKFLLSGTFSARKLTSAEVQNTTHFHSRLYYEYVHLARGNTIEWDNWRPDEDYDGTRDRWTRKWDVTAKNGQTAILVPRNERITTLHNAALLISILTISITELL